MRSRVPAVCASTIRCLGLREVRNNDSLGSTRGFLFSASISTSSILVSFSSLSSSSRSSSESDSSCCAATVGSSPSSGGFSFTHFSLLLFFFWSWKSRSRDAFSASVVTKRRRTMMTLRKKMRRWPPSSLMSAVPSRWKGVMLGSPSSNTPPILVAHRPSAVCVRAWQMVGIILLSEGEESVTASADQLCTVPSMLGTRPAPTLCSSLRLSQLLRPD
mmetsp:Transcript_24299/g.54624  ORF Transcript_24299/g.54624 Transcript_24299/m.54624 type:complete len:217 (+) Transcript_24299:3820-4470(+)